MPKNLFQLTEAATKRSTGEFFDCKTAAKTRRAELNRESFRYYVSPGPDHHRYRAYNRSMSFISHTWNPVR